MNSQLRIGRTLFWALALCLLAVSISFGQPRFSKAPLNPAFTAFRSALARGTWETATAEGRPLGDIPLTVDLSQVQQQVPPRPFQLEWYASSYDLRDVSGKLPPARDQGSCGACWAFATYGSLESCLRPAEAWDFSENNLKNTHGFDIAHCDGGNRDMSTAYLARWSGPIDESDDPYNPSSGTSPVGLSPQKHVQEVLFLPVRTGPTDNDTIKQAVLDYGGVYTSMYYHDAFYNATHHAYYYTGGGSTNHGIVIVGWDDNFPASYFKGTPSGDGAFIIRNSWGTSWGENGYFYISYYDTMIGMTHLTVLPSAEATTNYNTIYQYDPLGPVSYLGYGDDTAWGANVFNASYTGEEVAAVSFWAAVAGTSYQVQIYRNPTSGPIGGTLELTQTGSFTYGGYHTVVLSSPVTLTSGDTFSVVVRFTTPGYDYPIPFEYAVDGYSSGATASPGQSYYSHDGTSWADLTGYNSTANVCIKAFTRPGPTIVPMTDFSARQVNADVLLNWNITLGADYIAADVYRKEGGRMRKLTDAPVPLQPGKNHFRDTSGARSTARYILDLLTVTGHRERYGPISVMPKH